MQGLQGAWTHFDPGVGTGHQSCSVMFVVRVMSCMSCVFGVQVSESETETVQTEPIVRRQDCKGLWRSKRHPCAGAMLFMELQTAAHVFVHEASVTTHVGKSGVFKSSWDLFDDEPHSRNFEVEGKYMWPHPWLNAVLLPLPLHLKAYIFEIKNISLGPTGSLTERRLRSA